MLKRKKIHHTNTNISIKYEKHPTSKCPIQTELTFHKSLQEGRVRKKLPPFSRMNQINGHWMKEAPGPDQTGFREVWGKRSPRPHTRCRPHTWNRGLVVDKGLMEHHNQVVTRKMNCCTWDSSEVNPSLWRKTSQTKICKITKLLQVQPHYQGSAAGICAQLQNRKSKTGWNYDLARWMSCQCIKFEPKIQIVLWLHFNSTHGFLIQASWVQESDQSYLLLYPQHIVQRFTPSSHSVKSWWMNVSAYIIVYME